MKILKYPFIGLTAIIKFTIKFIKCFLIGIATIITILPYYLLKGLTALFSKKNNYYNQYKIEQKFIPITILTLSITTYLLSIFILTRWYVQYERTKNFTSNFSPIINAEDLEEDTPDQYQDLTSITPAPNTNYSINTQTNFINVNLNYYTQKNPETVAWIQVNGTKVNYPVVQHQDNNFYLDHDFYQRKTTNGWIFGDYRDNFESFENNTIIYGHNLINGTMFGSVPYLLNNNWFNNTNNQYIKLSTKNTNSIWQIFSVYKIEPTTDYLQVKFNSITAYQEFLNKLKNRSTHNFDIDINYTDKIITLSTCDNIGINRVAVHAKLINIENK